MGLDMYLNKANNIKSLKTSDIIKLDSIVYNLGDDYTMNTLKENLKKEFSIDVVDEIANNITIEDNGYYKTIFKEVGYWRKSNQIHKWFVDNVQNGVDDCNTYLVSPDKINELLDACKKVLSKKELILSNNSTDGDISYIENLLPTQSGFFFGGVQYDEWYFSDIESTIKQLTEVLENTDFNNEILFYHSSW